MSERMQVLADAAIRVIAVAGLRGLTFRAVDKEAGLPPGSTSNCFRTRAELIAGVVQRMADLELGDLAATAGDHAAAPSVFRQWSGDGLAQTLVRFELMIEAVRSPQVAEVLDENRSRFAALAESAGFVALTESAGPGSGIGFTAREFVAMLAGLQFAEITTGEKVLDKTMAWLLSQPGAVDTVSHDDGRAADTPPSQSHGTGDGARHHGGIA
ncbi:AcrR family transcriptional regulator [Rhodococcus sp. 27YEA15]|uniref:TetR/AcrR family transcriptional regulator n=1 Tax=Rhodococcus sp. 27YEA15 TaxID=3156259 RepID=UPI003C7E53F6